MKTMQFRNELSETQRDALVLTLRKAGYSASRESDTITTDASIAEIALAWGNSMAVKLA